MKFTCKLMLKAVLAAALVSGAAAAEIYVSPVGDDVNGGDAWNNAYATIQHALDQAASGDTIYVAGQTFALDSELAWTTAGITMIGGYKADDPGDQPGLSDPNQWPTVISRSGVATHRILSLNGADNSTLKHVRLTGGNAHGGSGLRIENSVGVLISGCVIDENAFDQQSTAVLSGAGLFLAANSQAVVTNSVIRNNIARNARNAINGHTQGGGIWNGGALSIVDSRIVNNATLCFNVGSIQTRGGGLYSAGPVLAMKNVLIAGNYARFEGGGMYIAGGDVSLDQVTVADNPGDGIYQTGGSTAISNSIVWGNLKDIAAVGGGLTVAFSNVGGTDFGGDNLSADPLFEYGYYLADGSPCTNAGSDTAASLGMDGFAKNTAGDVYAVAEKVNPGFHYPEGFDLTHANLHVAPDGDDELNTGLTAGSPFKTLTHALALARAGTRIHVAPGSYTRAGGESFPLVVPPNPGVQILGAHPDQTILDATGTGELRVMTMLNAHRAVLEGVTLTGGKAREGAGLHILRSQAVGVSDCILSNNTISVSLSGGTWSGGGVHAEGSAVVVSNCRVEGNFVENKHNGGHAHGGGIWTGSGGEMILENSRIAGNTAQNQSTAKGGGVYNAGSRLTVRNTLFADNKALSYGGGGLFFNAGVSTQENCTVVDNEPNGLRRDGGAAAVLNSILWNNGIDSTGTVTIAYSVVGNGGNFVDGGNNIGADPLLVDASAGDYHLQATSPAVGTGLVQAWMVGATDLDGAPRVSGGRVDRGAYQTPAPAGTLLLIR